MRSLIQLSVVAVVMWSLSSCSTYLPEFQRAEMLETGEHRVAMGAYYGGHIDDEMIVPGVAAFHSVGLSNQMEWTTVGSLGRFKVRNGELLQPDYLLATGPKWSINNAVAIIVPAGIFESWYSDEPGFVIMPSAHIEMYPNRYFKNWTHSMFLRSEFLYFEPGFWYGLTAGYKLEYSKVSWRPAININVSPVGGAVGYTMDLF